MKTLTFNLMIDRLHKYFRRQSLPDRETRDAWYARVKHISEDAVAYIEVGIQVGRDSLPGNLPKAMMALYINWQQRHPLALEFEEPTPCDECRSIGLLWGRKEAKASGTYYTPVFRCAKCSNWKRHIGANIAKKMPLVTFDDLRNMGYEPVIVPKSKLAK